MASVRDMVGEVVQRAVSRLDRSLPATLIASVSVSAERERARLRSGRRPFVEPGLPRPPAHEVAATAEVVVRQATFQATAMGGVAGLGGLAGVPPEVVGTAVGMVRLAQRLAVVYGFDPEEERGADAVRQALAAGLQIDLPDGAIGLKVSDLPRVLARRVPATTSVVLTRALVSTAAGAVLGTVGRVVPGISAGVGAYGQRRRTRDVGRRMAEVLARLAELDAAPAPGVIEAEEVR